jgi:hypothetical protein
VAAGLAVLTSLGWWQPSPVLGATFTVTNAADSGTGSLRAAIDAANASEVEDTIDFASALVITPATPLPDVTDTVTIDASSVSGPGGPGVVIDGSGVADGNGLTVTGEGAAGSTIRGLQVQDFPDAGIELDDVANTFVHRNVLGGNGVGVHIGAPGSTGNSLEGNRIGVDWTGTVAMANGTGVQVEGGPDTSVVDNTIGFFGEGEANVIAHNTGNGVEVVGDLADEVSVVGNVIRDNGGLGIDLGGDGVTANDGGGDSDSGPNGLLDTPVITSAVADGSTVSGTFTALDGGSYHIEVFASDACDPSGSGEGATLLATADVSDSGTFAVDALPINGTYLSATATLDEGSTSEFSPCFLVTEGLPAPGTWTGDGTGTTVAVGNGAAGPAQFTYDVLDADPGAGDGEAGSWTFYTTAATSGTIEIPWRYSGFHAFFQVTVELKAVVISGGDVDTEEVLVDAGPASCCTTPSAGFDFSGTASFTVEPGDVYGFELAGTNFDSNETLLGELVLGTQVPTDCADAQSLYGAEVDGRYVIHPVDGQRFRIYCADMDAAGADYLEIGTGPGVNTGQYAAGGAASGTTVTSSFEKLRLDPANLTVDIGDRRFATSTGSLIHPDSGGNQAVSSMSYATAMGCGATGAANVDLRGTPFAVDDSFTPGSLGFGGATFSEADQVVNVTGNGNCGWVSPNPAAYNPFNPVPGDFSLQLRYLVEPPVTLATPVLFASIAGSGNTADLYARVEGAENASLDVEIRSADTCTNGALDSPTMVGTASAVTDAEGYVLFAGVPSIASGDFVTIRVTDPPIDDASPCVRTTADNDYWPKALDLGSGATLTTQDVIDLQGKARWYRFAIVPGQQVTVNLSGLPADYDLAVFRDIAREFESQLVPTDTGDLERLSAEFAPSVFSPSVFSPSVFSPSVFSPDAYAPSVFSPSVFSPSVFSPSVFSPSVFSPSVFSPSVFSPSVFSPSVFSPSVFSPSVFSPSVFSPSVFSEDEIAQAFSSAQTRSLIGVSATPGTGDETVVVNSWNNTGEFYIRVSGRAAAFDQDGLFTVTVTKGASDCTGVTDTTLTPRADQPPVSVDSVDLQTIILTDSTLLPLGDGTPGSLLGKLNAFRVRPEVAGVLVDLASDARAGELRAQAAANAACPFATNLLAAEIKGIVDSYRANNPGLRYVVIAGDDTVVPFFRYPDQSLLGQESGYYPPVKSDSISEASLRNDYVLGQDAYGSGVAVSLRTSAFPIPGLAVGRLVETPAEIGGLLDAYTAAGGVVAPSSSLVTGYDFLEDAANAVRDELAAGTGGAPATLITPNGVSPQDPAAWTANDLRTALFGSRHDVVFLAGHFSANSALAADFSTSVITTELAASAANLENALVFSAGCHSGYNLVDDEALPGASLPLDWAQAFAQKRSILVAGTGYQYGDTDFLEYSERLYRDFSRELRAGPAGSAISVGEALVRAKLAYLASTPDIRGIHEKALLEATLFGLPMFGVNMPAGRGATPGSGAAITPTPAAGGTPAGDLGLATAPLSLAYPDGTLQPRTLDLKNPPYDAVPGTFTTARWLEGPDGVITNPAEPALPLDAVGVTSTNPSYVLRGVGFRGGTYVDTPGITPLTGAPTTELRGVHAPFVSPVFYPMKLWTPNYFGALGGSGGTNLLVTPVQHTSDPAALGQTVQRRFTGLDLKLFYSNNLTTAALSDAPTIVQVTALRDGGDVVFTAQVVGDPKVAVHEVWVTWTTGLGTWTSLDLAQCVAPLDEACGSAQDSRIWAGRLVGAPVDFQYVAQAANGLGLVAFDDNRGRYYGTATVAPVATALTLIGPPAGGSFGGSASVTAELTAGGTPLAGQTVFVTIGGAGAFGTTGDDGRVTVDVPLSSQPGTTQIVASFEGDGTHGPSSALSSPFTIAKAASTLTLAGPTATAAGPTLVATLSGAGIPLQQETVAFLVTAPGGITTLSPVITDYQGQAKLVLPSGVGGVFGVTASFGSVVSVPGGGTLDLTNATFGPASASLTVRFAQYAFTSTRDGNFEIYRMLADGSGQTRITLHGAVDTEASWSPNASRIAFASSRTGNGDIYVMNADGTGLTRLTTSSAVDGAPAWSPDGTKIAFTSRRDGNFEIYVMNADGSGQTRLTNNRAIDNEPEWSPDGTKISFTSTRTGLGDIYVMTANGSGVTRLTASSAVDGTSAWSPDGTKIVFTSRRDGNFEVYRMNANGSSQTRLTNNGAVDTEPAWSVDGTRIVFASSRTGNGDIYSMDPDGTGVVRLTTSSSLDGSPAAG